MLLRNRVELIRAGRDPLLIARLPSGFWLLSEVQHFPGASMLLADPIVPHFNVLHERARVQWALDLGKIGDVMIATLGAIRVNYETWGNLDPVLHTHITPRFDNEDEKSCTLPPRVAFNYANPPPFDPLAAETIALIRKLSQKFSHPLG